MSTATVQLDAGGMLLTNTKVDTGATEQIVARTREQKYGLRSLVHAVVQSELFLNK